MHFEQHFRQVGVIGATGKMGRGISLLVLQEMAQLKAQHPQDYRLICVNTIQDNLDLLQQYLHKQMIKFAERNIIKLRSWYEQRRDLIDNEQMIRTFVEDAMASLHLSITVEDLAGVDVLFEAVVEDVEVKTTILKAVKPHLAPEALVLTNTSSIPIHLLAEKTGLQEHLMGFHFYNPPPVQKLLELIVPPTIPHERHHLAKEIAHKLNKVIVHSADIAGFIGNGHFIRELNYACIKASQLAEASSLEYALEEINRVTREFLIRPMGIFQLADFIGLDICLAIASIMRTYQDEFKGTLSLLQEMYTQGVRGGQNPDGTQREGIFKYQNNQPIALYSLQRKQYVPIPDVSLGSLPEGHLQWKYAQRDPQAIDKMYAYLQHLFQEQSPGAILAREYLQTSSQIAQLLVSTGVAQSLEDVDRVLRLGFYHVYGIETVLGAARTFQENGVSR